MMNEQDNPQDSYDASYAFVVIMHQRLQYKLFRDITGRPIVNVTDLVNCLINKTLALSALDRHYYPHKRSRHDK